MLKNRITCDNLIQLAEICAELTMRNITFSANAGTLTITITGY